MKINDMKKITFRPLNNSHLPLWKKWTIKPYVEEVWFLEGYATPEQIFQNKQGNSYDYPFIVYYDDKPIGFIQACDLYAYRKICKKPVALFSHEKEGTFGIDLFIGEEDYLNKGYGTQIIKSFIDYIFKHFSAKKIIIAPATTNKRAIRCYEKAGFTFIKEGNDGVTDCYIMQLGK